ncbi:MAG: hypothetical protein KIS92_23910 [Planctomycetota bacterium]|nr:hypothetical protein [Planctomycetota bacterium]
MSKTCCLAVLVLLALAARAEDEPTAIVQDFEQPIEINKWPAEKPGKIERSTEWKADGEQSLRIDAGLMAALSQLKLKNWKDYSVLRVSVNNTTDKTVTIGFELQDQHTTFHERHQNGFGVQPGVHVIELDFSGGLWRGEQNAPYKGKIKTPIDVGGITRVSFTNEGEGPIYLDKIEVVKVKKLETPGGFAFDFQKNGHQVMSQWIGVSEATPYKDGGFGMVGGRPSLLNKVSSYPTPMLGDGAAFNAGGFKVDLPGGDYLGWIAFERGGFWEGEQCAYSHAALKANGTVVHEHDFAPAGPHFFFQDTEITDLAQLKDKLIWPAAAAAAFKFKAEKGVNHFTLDLKDENGLPLRVAGMILAPATPEGQAFIDAHLALQNKTIDTTYAAQDRGRRKDRKEPAKALVVEPLPPGAQVYPRDWPTAAEGAPIPELTAVTGQKVTVHLAVYAKTAGSASVAAAPLKGPGSLPAPAVSYGRYMPQRAYGVGAVWLDVNHYRPEPAFDCGPELTRSVVVEYDVPADAKPGAYEGSVEIAAGAEKLSLPVKLQVAAVKLAAIPRPVGLFMNALPFEASAVGDAEWWKLQESLAKEQGEAGLNCPAGGAGLGLRFADGKISGDAAVKYLKMAAKYGMDKGFTNYGGFLGRLNRGSGDPAAVFAALTAFEKDNGLPPFYWYSYDEPSTETEQNNVLAYLEPYTKAGIRTIGYTSVHNGSALWEKLRDASYAPAFNIHTGDDLKKLKAAGGHPWVYNNGLDRYGLGLHLWRGFTLGAEGRMQWIGLYTQGFAYHNLDGREPSYPCFFVHSKFGALKTPMWLSVREGLLDARIRYTLEAAAKPGDPALAAWSTDGYKTDEPKWTDAELDKTRLTMLKRLQELAK